MTSLRKASGVRERERERTLYQIPATGWQPGTFSCGQSYTQIWILKDGTRAAEGGDSPSNPPFRSQTFVQEFPYEISEQTCKKSNVSIV